MVGSRDYVRFGWCTILEVLVLMGVTNYLQPAASSC